MPNPPMLLKKHTHEERLELGRQLSKQIVDTYGDKIVAVLVTGSTAKNLDRPYSDLEMIAIIRNGVEIPIAQYIHDGMSIQIDYVEGSSFLKDASRITFNWPLSQDQFRNRIVLYDPTAWISKLDKVVAESETADTRKRLVIGQLMAALYEGLEVIKNAQLENDEIGIRTAGFYLAWDAARLVLLMNKRYVLTSSWFWKETKDSVVKPKGFWTREEKLAGFVRASVEEIVESAESLCDDMLKIVESLSISIEPAKLLV